MMLTKLNKGKDFLLQNGIFYILALFIAFGLKYHYSHALSDDLDWILGPTAALVGYASSIDFDKEENAGFVNREQRIIIAPSCAGVNFLIIAFCMTIFSCLHRLRRTRSKLICLGISALGSYFLAVFVNTLRIIVSIYLYEADIYNGWITPERVHRIEGIAIYFFFLCVFYLIIRKIMNHYAFDVVEKKKTETGKNLKISDYTHQVYAGLAPLIWYFLFVIIIPLINTTYQGKVPQFVEHYCVVISVCFGVFLLVFLIRLCCRHISGNIMKSLLFRSHKTEPRIEYKIF